MSWLNKLWPKLGSTPRKKKLSLRSKAKHVDLNLPPPSMEPISNFTPRAEQALALARTEAERLHHKHVGAEHVLLGLLALGQGVAANVFFKRGMSLEAVRGEVGRQVGPSPSQKIVGQIPYAAEVRTVLAKATEEAQSLRHTYVGTEHILLGLLAQPGDVVPRVLKHFPVEPRFLRQDVLSEFGRNGQPGVPTTTPAPAPVESKSPDPAPASKPKKLSLPLNSPPPAKATPSAPAAATKSMSSSPPAKTPQPVSSPPPAKAPLSASVPPPAKTTASPSANGALDLAQRFDIYCTDTNQSLTVHRNARFKSLKQLLPGSQNDPLAAFFELELENGQTIFVPRSSVIRFEPHTPVAVK